MRSAVCFDVGTAEVLVAAGFGVVLARPDAAAAGIRGKEGPGRIAVFVTDDHEAAEAMAAELFGASPIVVKTVEAARSLAQERAGYEAPASY